MTSASDWTHSASSRQLIIRFAGEVDEGSAHHLRRSLTRALPGPVGRVLVDLSEVPSMDTAGLAVLVEAKARLGDRLWLRGVRPQVRALMQVTGLLETLGVSGHDPAGQSAGRTPDPRTSSDGPPDSAAGGPAPARLDLPTRDGSAADRRSAAGATRTEQAVRILAEAYGCDADEAWQMLFRTSRAHSVLVHELTRAVVESAWGDWRSARSRDTTARALDDLLPADLRGRVPEQRHTSDEGGTPQA